MAGYTKLFASITDSTIWQAPDTTRLVWVTMLAMADAGGCVSASVPGLASRARVSIEACIAALDAFKNPDEWSRTKDFDGRRIIEVDGGWVLLNHSKYRAMREIEDRKEAARLGMAKLRAKRKANELTNVKKVNDVSHGLPRLAHSDAEASSDSNTKSKKNTERTASASRLPDDFAPDFQFAVDNGIQNPSEEAARFRDYWIAQPGAKGRKLDWQATWRNWCRNSKPHSRASPPTETAYQASQRRKVDILTGRNRSTGTVIDCEIAFLENEL